ncbi:MAG: hypothetical protein CMJ86_01900 [Planctomycetes bacterium]|nr:hypothetical protein [Planctomycetota bacterium]
MQPLQPPSQSGDGSDSVPSSIRVQNQDDSSSLLIASLRSRLAQACVQIDTLRRQSEDNALRVDFLQHALELERARSRRAVREFRDLRALNGTEAARPDDGSPRTDAGSENGAA